MNVLYNFPRKAAFGRILPKSKIYEHATPGSKVKEFFVQEVEKITWSYKISPETVNLPVSDGVQEIQVITIALKTGMLKSEVLQTIDKAIPSPILFTLTYGKKTRYVAAYKRPSESDKSKWVVSGYFETDWISDDTKRTELPVVLNLAALYQTFIKSIIPLPPRKDETLADLTSRVDRLRMKEREAAKVDSRLKMEKQFNRKVQLNTELKKLNQDIEQLKR